MELVKIKNAAEIAGVHKNTILNWITAGLLKKHKIGVGKGLIRIDKEELLRVCRGQDD